MLTVVPPAAVALYDCAFIHVLHTVVLGFIQPSLGLVALSSRACLFFPRFSSFCLLVFPLSSGHVDIGHELANFACMLIPVLLWVSNCTMCGLQF